MKSDPARLLDAHSGADPLQRALLSSLRKVTPPAGAQEQTWQALSRSLAGAAALGAGALVSKSAAASGSAAPLSASAWAQPLLVKLGVGAGVSVLAVASYTLLAPGPAVNPGVPAGHAAAGHTAAGNTVPAVSVTAAHAPATPLVQPAAEPPLNQEPAAVDSAVASPNVSPRHTEPASKASALLQESQLLASARAALRSGDVNTAQALLARLGREHPRGVLSQEREVLNIELLAKRGQHAAASARAQTFIQAHPKSPHAANLTRFVVAR